MIEVLNTFISKSPSLPFTRYFQWQTDLVSYGSQREQRNQIWPEPLRHWRMDWNYLPQINRDELVELSQRAHGRFRIFLYQDPKDYHTAFGECSITADGTAGPFQLIKTYYPDKPETWTEHRHRIVPDSETIRVEGTTKARGTDYTIDNDTGKITFESGKEPGSGDEITAAFDFYFLVRFDFDLHQDLMVIADIWQAKGVEIIEVKE